MIMAVTVTPTHHQVFISEDPLWLLIFLCSAYSDCNGVSKFLSRSLCFSQWCLPKGSDFIKKIKGIMKTPQRGSAGTWWLPHWCGGTQGGSLSDLWGITDLLCSVYGNKQPHFDFLIPTVDLFSLWVFTLGAEPVTSLLCAHTHTIAGAPCVTGLSCCSVNLFDLPPWANIKNQHEVYLKVYQHLFLGTTLSFGSFFFIILSILSHTTVSPCWVCSLQIIHYTLTLTLNEVVLSDPMLK